jgi:hypothetical protein
VEAMKAALALEKTVNEALYKLHEVAVTNKDDEVGYVRVKGRYTCTFQIILVNSFSSGDKFHIFHSIPSDINISTSIYPPLKRKPPLKSS